MFFVLILYQCQPILCYHRHHSESAILNYIKIKLINNQCSLEVPAGCRWVENGQLQLLVWTNYEHLKAG